MKRIQGLLFRIAIITFSIFIFFSCGQDTDAEKVPNEASSQESTIYEPTEGEIKHVIKHLTNNTEVSKYVSIIGVDSWSTELRDISEIEKYISTSLLVHLNRNGGREFNKEVRFNLKLIKDTWVLYKAEGPGLSGVDDSDYSNWRNNLYYKFESPEQVSELLIATTIEEEPLCGLSVPLDEMEIMPGIERYESNEMGTTEYLHMNVLNGQRKWTYSSDKNPKSIKLGVKKVNGAESLFFYSDKKTLYRIKNKKCGIALTNSKDRKTQNYSQTYPPCEY